jgi:hypothetical protein
VCVSTPEELARARRAERRAALRRAHPDLGGSSEALRHVLAAERVPVLADVVVVSVRLRSVRRRARAATTTLRTRLPRRVPGSLRRFTL